MDASALARELDNLENSWSSLDRWLNFWTVLVVIGVAVELLIIITEYTHDWRDFKHGTIHSPDKPSILIFGFGFLGAALVAIGVAGEFRVHTKAGKIESDMRSKSRELVGLAQRAAGEANKEAEQLRKDSEGLKKQAESERLARMEIEDRVAWRHLTKGQQPEMAERLRKFAGQWASVGRVSYDVEITSFATDIATVLRSAGWHVLPPSPITFKGVKAPGFDNPIEPVITGVTITRTADSRAADMAEAVMNELHSHGFDAVITPKTEPNKGFSVISVLVEARPEGPQGEAKVRTSRKKRP